MCANKNSSLYKICIAAYHREIAYKYTVSSSSLSSFSSSSSAVFFCCKSLTCHDLPLPSSHNFVGYNIEVISNQYTGQAKKLRVFLQLFRYDEIRSPRKAFYTSKCSALKFKDVLWAHFDRTLWPLDSIKNSKSIHKIDVNYKLKAKTRAHLYVSHIFYFLKNTYIF